MSTTQKNTGLLSGKVNLSRKELNTADADKAVHKIHTALSQGKIKRVTVDFPDTVHTAMKLKTVNTDVTIRDYILNLVAKDLGGAY
jgi:hypothetical protein